MLKSIQTTKEDLIAVRLTGSLDKQDYDLMLPVLESKIKQFGKIDLYWEMEESSGWKPGGLWEDLKFDLKYVNSFRKVAIIGDKQWEEWIARMAKPFTSAEIKFFNIQQKEEALTWVSQ